MTAAATPPPTSTTRTTSSSSRSGPTASLAAHDATARYTELMGALLPLLQGQGSGLRLRRTS